MFLRIGTFEFFIDAAPQYSFFEVDHAKHDADNREIWAFRRHFIVSRLRPRKT